MFVNYFTEQPMSAYPAQEALKRHPDDHPARRPGDTILLFSNRFFDPVEGSRLFNERLEEAALADELDFDGIMVNEHHNGAFCMSSRCSVSSAALAVATKRLKITQMGNPLPLYQNPVLLAEEIAMVDMISRGRVIAGIVRGGGNEQLAANVNPAYNRERFTEAHDLLIKTWTEPGPFRWEGEHYDMRVVNPWSLPMQKPFPRIMVPGIASQETIVFAAQHAYPYIILNSKIEDVKKIWALYDSVARDTGYEAGSEHRGYLVKCHVADTEEKARQNALEFQWMAGEFTGVGHPAWTAPTGYSSYEARMRRRAQASANNSFDAQVGRSTIIYGTPDQVVAKLRYWMEETRPSILMLWGNDGRVPHEAAARCIELLGTEVVPAVREIGEELGIQDPFQKNAPVGFGFSGLQPLGAGV